MKLIVTTRGVVIFIALVLGLATLVVGLVVAGTVITRDQPLGYRS